MIVRMTRTFLELSQLTNRALLARVDELVRRERRVQAALIANLSELDARRLYLDEGCSSFYVYCMEKLGYSESAAYRRMEASRAVRRYPVVLERLENGALNLTTVALLAKHLTAANHRALLEVAAGKSRVEVEALIARVSGASVAPPRSTVRVVPVAAPVTAPQGGVVGVAAANELAVSWPGGAAEASHASGGDITQSTSAGGSDRADRAARTGASDAAPTPGAPGALDAAAATVLAYRHAITLTAEEQADLERARELLRTLIPNGDPAQIIGKALRQLLATLEARKFGAVKKPRAAQAASSPDTRFAPDHDRRTTPPRDTRTADASETRTIPAAVRRAVTARDEGRVARAARCGHAHWPGALRAASYVITSSQAFQSTPMAPPPRWAREAAFGVIE
jgi:hypothetical protein